MGALYLSPSLKFMSRNTWLDISVSHLATCKTPFEKIIQSFILDFQMFWNCFDLHMMTKAVGSSRDGVVWPRGPRLNLADLQSFFTWRQTEGYPLAWPELRTQWTVSGHSAWPGGGSPCSTARPGGRSVEGRLPPIYSFLSGKSRNKEQLFFNEIK